MRRVVDILEAVHLGLLEKAERGELALAERERGVLFFAVGAAWARAEAEERRRR